MNPLDEEQWLDRYSRHILMPQMDVAGQQRLQQSRVLVIGAGGLGCPVVLYLAASGVGAIDVMDHDSVELSNLQRQIGHRMDDLGKLKAVSLAQAAQRINPQCRVVPIATKADAHSLPAYVATADVVVDCTDRFATRFMINKACVKGGKPLVSGAAIRMEGQLAVFNVRDPASPCYHCLYPDFSDEGMTCSESGVLSPLVGLIGSLQALETVKLLAQVGEVRLGRLTLWDAARTEVRQVRIPRDPQCPTCASRLTD